MIADTLGVSIDTLFGRDNTFISTEKVIENDIISTPDKSKLIRAYELTWHIIRSVINCHEYSVQSIQDFLNSLDYTDRSLEEVSDRSLYLLFTADDRGIMQASIAKDFKYALIMPEPDNSFSSIMKCKEDMHTFFNMLVKPNRLEMMIFLYSRRITPFTAGLAAKALSITEKEALAVLLEFNNYCIAQQSTIDTVDGIQDAFCVRPGCEFVPFFYFTSEMMRNRYFTCLSWYGRDNPFFASDFGEGGYNSTWITKKSMTDTTVFGPTVYDNT